MTWVNDVRSAGGNHERMIDIPAMAARADDTARDWVNGAVLQPEREAARSADTHLIHVEFNGVQGIRFYFKDEADHPTGSLKHRLTRSLFLYALCDGWLPRGQTVVDASSGSTAIPEAWFACLPVHGRPAGMHRARQAARDP